MPLGTFLDKIDVTLGSAFKGGGNGLSENDPITLTRDGATDYWYEDSGGSSTANSSTNRLKMLFGNGWGAFRNFLYGAKTGTGWYSLLFMKVGSLFAGSGDNYNFKELWNVGSLATPTASVTLGGGSYTFKQYPGRNAGSVTQAISDNGTNGPAFIGSNYNARIFKTMEEYTPPSLVDKTVYVFV